MKLVELTAIDAQNAGTFSLSINPAQVDAVGTSSDEAIGCRVYHSGRALPSLIKEPYADVVSAINEALAPVPIKIPAMMGMPAGLAMPQGMLVK